MTPNPDDFPEIIFTNATRLDILRYESPEIAKAMNDWRRCGGDILFWHRDKGGWMPREEPSSELSPPVTYRAVRPAFVQIHCPDAVWRVFDPEWRWITQDSHGCLEIYDTRPRVIGGVWIGNGKYLRITGVFADLRPGVGPWQGLIIERPEGL